jgi:hypothetical protein
MHHFNNMIAAANASTRNVCALVASNNGNFFATIKSEILYRFNGMKYSEDIRVPVIDELGGNKYTCNLSKLTTSFTGPDKVTVVSSSTPTTANWGVWAP